MERSKLIPARPFPSVFSITCLVADPLGLDALWLLPIEHHAYELQAVDAQIQQRSST